MLLARGAFHFLALTSLHFPASHKRRAWLHANTGIIIIKRANEIPDRECYDDFS